MKTLKVIIAVLIAGCSSYPGTMGTTSGIPSNLGVLPGGCSTSCPPPPTPTPALYCCNPSSVVSCDLPGGAKCSIFAGPAPGSACECFNTSGSGPPYTLLGQGVVADADGGV